MIQATAHDHWNIYSLTPAKNAAIGLNNRCRICKLTSGYATWFTAGGAIRIADYDVIDDVITRKLYKR